MRNNAAYLAACVAMVAAFAASPLPAAELTHRWSFNGDWSDSAGGAEAVKCGTYASLYGNRVHLGYNGAHGQGYINLGTNIIDTAAATIEIWARHDGVKKWSRVFDYGADDTHYFYVGWSFGTTLASERVEFYNSANGAKTYQDNTMGSNPNGYEIGRDYYIAITLQRQSESSTFMRWQRRDATTGELLGSGSMTAANGVHTFTDPVLYLGHSQYTADNDALAAYDEVRLWSGVLTDAQLAASAAEGPDATIATDAGVPRFVAPESGGSQSSATVRPSLPNGGFRLMTYNVQYCYDEVNTIIPDRTAARILAENPDFCCINEVRDTEAHPEATILAKLTGMHKTFCGNLILSKEAPLSKEEVFLKMSDQGYGDRYCLICEFTNFCVAVTHLDTTKSGGDDAVVQASNAVAIATIRNVFTKYTKPVFLCGDWNTRPYWVNMDRFNEFLEILSPTNGNARTYHGHNATGGYILDYISVDKVHKDDFLVQSSYVVEDIVTSDHNPVIAEMYCRPASSDLGWVDESFLSVGRTGTWEPSLAWSGSTWKAELGGDSMFTPNTSSGGNRVTMDVTATFDAIPLEYAAPSNTAQAAIWLGTNGSFQVWTKAGNGELGTYPPSEASAEGGSMRGGNGWVDVEADGVTPQTGVDYTFRFVFDYAAKTYDVEVQTGLTGFTRLREKNPVNPVNPVRTFPLATIGSALSGVRFAGDGVFTSLLGEWENALPGFRILIR